MRAFCLLRADVLINLTALSSLLSIRFISQPSEYIVVFHIAISYSFTQLAAVCDS